MSLAPADSKPDVLLRKRAQIEARRISGQRSEHSLAEDKMHKVVKQRYAKAKKVKD